MLQAVANDLTKIPTVNALVTFDSAKTPLTEKGE
jgi:hypothetical protein